MKIKTLNLALLALLVLALGAVGFARNGSTLAAGAGETPKPAEKTTATGSAPSWSAPVRTTPLNTYDNFPGIAASPVNDGVSIANYQLENNVDSRVVVNSNHTLGGAFDSNVWLETAGRNQMGGNNIAGPFPEAHDQAGNRHIVWWRWVNDFAAYYTIINNNGDEVLTEQIPASNDGQSRKLQAIWVDNVGTAHIAMARPNVGGSLGYWARTASGDWTSVNERVPGQAAPNDLAIATTTNGVVMLAFKDLAVSGTATDIYVGSRVNGSWTIDDISAACCSWCPNASGAYLPQLYPDEFGGMHATWSDGRCNDQDNEIFYRQWLPGSGWVNQPIVQLTNNIGESYWNDMAVDGSGEVYVVFADDTGSPVNYFRTMLMHGRGTAFTAPELPFAGWWDRNDSWQKEVAMDYANGIVHIAFGANRDNSLKDNYYSFVQADPGEPPCPGERFQDVCPDNTFYQYVNDLAERGVIGGYTTAPPCPNARLSPCFLPGNTATRAQMAKIIVLAADLPTVSPNTSTFQDVQPGTTFYTVTESAAAYGVITGYPCGSPGEPCVAPGNKPYFRPNNSVTRGQLAKMTSIAFDFNEPVSGQLFQDVAPGSTFYDYVQRLANREIISGYACGGPGEPCIAPDNRPYFRPNNNVTRGQTAKIVDISLHQSLGSTPTVTVVVTATATASATSTLVPVTPTATSTSIPRN